MDAIKMVVAVIVCIFSFFYLLPWMMAWTNNRSNTAAIGALNIFLGWTLIGWVLSLVWALKKENTI